MPDLSEVQSAQPVKIVGQDATGQEQYPVNALPLGLQTQAQVVEDLLNRMLLELKCIRLAMSAMACDGGKNAPSDFDPDTLDGTL